MPRCIALPRSAPRVVVDSNCRSLSTGAGPRFAGFDEAQLQRGADRLKELEAASQEQWSARIVPSLRVFTHDVDAKAPRSRMPEAERPKSSNVNSWIRSALFAEEQAKRGAERWKELEAMWDSRSCE